ncbi:hypothetical protein GGS20DRAFT_584779 [Poronia punctata]|nr:hypothetical protein GGS20DRAFT_584779 [Poronia punctata]
MRDDKVYIITGGYSGIGLDRAKSLLLHPSTTTVAILSDGRAVSALERLLRGAPSGPGSTVHIIQLDISAVRRPEMTARSIIASTGIGKVDVIINNAPGVYPMADPYHKLAEHIRAALGVHSIPPMAVFEPERPPMLQPAAWLPRPRMVRSYPGSMGSVGMGPMPAGPYCVCRCAQNWPSRAMEWSYPGSMGFRRMGPMPAGAYGVCRRCGQNWPRRVIRLGNMDYELVPTELHPGRPQTMAGQVFDDEYDDYGGRPTTLQENVDEMFEVLRREHRGRRAFRGYESPPPW